MIVKRLYLADFLSYGMADVALTPGLNVVVGENAAGKTNLIDAIYLASVGKSSRAYKEKELIRWGAEHGARLKLLIQKEFSTHTVELYIDPFGKRRILIDDIPIVRLGELLGVLNVVFFSPDEMKLIKESPDYRRRFMDISLSQQKRRYFYELVRYNKLLQQRNNLLKTESHEKDAMVQLVTRQMLPSAKYVMDERLLFLKDLELEAAHYHQILTGGREELGLSYQTEETAEEELFARYMAAYPRDKELRYTTVGPHRDDIKITAGGIDIRKFGSQGQQRTAVLSMKLAEAKLFLMRTGEKPILLLDDVLSELDSGRMTALLDAVSEYQTIVTCTELPAGALHRDYQILVVKDKQIRSEKNARQ